MRIGAFLVVAAELRVGACIVDAAGVCVGACVAVAVGMCVWKKSMLFVYRISYRFCWMMSYCEYSILMTIRYPKIHH
jgi:hypothetical protein